jgi:ubiquinone biosynthesis protein UbiJ
MIRSLPVIEFLVNQAIQWDPRVPSRLEPLNTKQCRVEIVDILTFDILFSKERLQLLPPLSETVDTTIKGPLSAFLSLSLTKNTHDAAQQGLSVEGDIITANHIQKLFLTLSIDWEELLSRVTGDILAHQLFGFLKTAKQKQAAFFESLSSTTRLYVTEEAHLLPTMIELNQFFNDIDQIRSDADRLEAKIHLLEQKRSSLSSETQIKAPK